MKLILCVLLLMTLGGSGYAMTREEAKDNITALQMTLEKYNKDNEFVPFITPVGRIQLFAINEEVKDTYQKLDMVEGVLIKIKKYQEPLTTVATVEPYSDEDIDERYEK